MADNWTTIGEIAQVFDGPHATPKKIEEGPYFLSISSLEKGILDLSKSARISEEQFSQWTRRVTPREGDVLFSYETRLGEAALMPEGIKACLGRRMGLLRPNPQKVDSRFLLYVYLGPEFQQEIRTRTIYGATVERIALKELPDFPIEIPDITTQRKIAHIIGSIDDKIELNRRMNETLEAMAQALFQSWFVDFDPVIDKALATGKAIPEELREKAERRRALGEKRRALPADVEKLFPDEFEWSDEMGWVPKGWGTGQIGDVCTVRKGLSYKGKYLSHDRNDVPMMNLGNFAGEGKIKKEKTKYYSGEYKDRHVVEAGHLMIANTDMTQHRIILGSPIIVPEFAQEKIIFTHHAFAIDFDKNRDELIWKRYMYFVAQDREFRKRATGFATGTTVLALPKDALLKCPFLLPNERLLESFSTLVESSFEQQNIRDTESATLANLRDTLLPKLISGELRVPEAEKLVNEAL